MAQKAFPKIKAANSQRVLNVRGDPPDIRDRIYEPALVRLKSEIDHREPGLILDQGQEGACTGFGLTAVINLLNLRRGTGEFKASARMLYEWPSSTTNGRAKTMPDRAAAALSGAGTTWASVAIKAGPMWPVGLTNA